MDTLSVDQGKFSAEDRRMLASVLASLSRDAGHSMSLDSLLTQWAGIVDEVERGYELTGDDFRNDLTTRDILEALCDELSPEAQTILRDTLRPFDERFEKGNGGGRWVARTEGAVGRL